MLTDTRIAQMQLDIQVAPVAMTYAQARAHACKDLAEFNRGWEAYQLRQESLDPTEFADWQKGWWMALSAEAEADAPFEEEPGYRFVGSTI